MAHPVCATGTWSRLILGPEFGWAVGQSHNLTPRFRQKLSELSKLEPAESRLSELLIVALGGNETFYVAYKTRAGEIRQDSYDLNPALQAFLFPKDGTTRDFSTLQVVMNWGWTYYAQDKDGRVYDKLPPNLDKVVKERENQSQWPRTLALGQGQSYVYIGRDDHVEKTLIPQQQVLQSFLDDPEHVKKIEYIFLDPYNDWKNYMMCLSDGSWTAFFHGQIFNGHLNEAVRRNAGWVSDSRNNAGSVALSQELERLKADLKDAEARRNADLEKQKKELTMQYQKLEEEHTELLRERKSTTTNEGVETLKEQHGRELQLQKASIESKVRAQYEKELQEQKNMYEKKEPREKEHQEALEQLRKSFEAKLVAREAEIESLRARTDRGERSVLSEHSIVSTPMAAAMPPLGNLMEMFQRRNYQLGSTLNKTVEESRGISG